QGDGLAAGSELGHLERAGTADHKADPQRREQEQLRLPPGHRLERQQQPVHQGDQNRDPQDEIDPHVEDLARGRGLLLKEIGGHGQSGVVPGYWNDTLGAARSVSAVSSSGAFLKPNMPATLTAGKTSRRML